MCHGYVEAVAAVGGNEPGDTVGVRGKLKCGLGMNLI